MHQLTAREATLLNSESRTNLGHTSFYVVLEPGKDGPLVLDQLRDALQSRMGLAPGFRRRVWQVPLGLDHPWWIEDPRFDIDYHLRHIAVPDSGSESDLTAMLARLHERQLDRRRPLWEMYLIDQHDGMQGIFTKIHFALIDGVTGIDVLAPLTDEGPVDSDPTWQPDLPPSDTDLLIRAGWSTARSPLRWLDLILSTTRLVPGLQRHALPALQARWAAPQGTIDIDEGELTPPRVSFNRAIGTHRRIEFASLPISKIRSVRKRHGVRFHDVILALVAGSLRHWLVLHDELPTEPLVALSPILVDSVDEPLGTALISLATHRHNRAERLLEIAEWTQRIGEALEDEPVNAVRRIEAASPAVASLASRLVVRTGAATRFHPPFNVYLVNVPGNMDEERKVLGSEIQHQYPLATIVDGTGLSISAMSHRDRVDVSFVADRDLVPDLEIMADQLEVELRALQRAKTSKAA